MGALDRALVLVALKDADARVSAAAIRLAEKWLANPADRLIFERATEAASGSDQQPPPNVILQQALSLGEAASPNKHDALARLAERHGRLPFMADAIASGLAGKEEVFIELVSSHANADNAGPAVASAVRSVLHAGDAARMLRVLSLAAASETSPWARAAVLDGVTAFLPRRADGALVTGVLPAEPSPLIVLAAHADSADGARAAELLQHLRWPGKPGDVAEAVKLNPAETKLFEQGRAQYAALCANCHQPDGQGLAGLAPPLVNSRWVLGSEQLAASIVLCGKEDDGKVMPTLRGVLDDQAIASVLTFVRNSWGHAAKAVDVETVAKARAETASHGEPFHETELIELSQSH
jgi:mono/diheme cytochrome c family protein